MNNTFLPYLKNSFGMYYLAVNKGYTYATYQQEIMVPALERLETGEIKKLFMALPPRHAKSDMTTVNFSSWFLGRNPTKTVLVMSYSAELATEFGRKVRNIMDDPMYKAIFPKVRISSDTRAKDDFSTDSGGRFFAVGFNGIITGRGVHLLIIDDPIKNMQSANSEADEKFRRETYLSAVHTRLEPGGCLICCLTMWPGSSFGQWVLDEDSYENFIPDTAPDWENTDNE